MHPEVARACPPSSPFLAQSPPTCRPTHHPPTHAPTHPPTYPPTHPPTKYLAKAIRMDKAICTALISVPSNVDGVDQQKVRKHLISTATTAPPRTAHATLTPPRRLCTLSGLPRCFSLPIAHVTLYNEGCGKIRMGSHLQRMIR